MLTCILYICMLLGRNVESTTGVLYIIHIGTAVIQTSIFAEEII